MKKDRKKMYMLDEFRQLQELEYKTPCDVLKIKFSNHFSIKLSFENLL